MKKGMSYMSATDISSFHGKGERTNNFSIYIKNEKSKLHAHTCAHVYAYIGKNVHVVQVVQVLYYVCNDNPVIITSRFHFVIQIFKVLI